MPIFKPAVSQATATVSGSAQMTDGPAEVVGLHFFNSTAGVGRVDFYDGTASPGNLRVTLGVAVASGSDDYTPLQPIKFKNYLRVVFTTGTGVVTFTLS